MRESKSRRQELVLREVLAGNGAVETLCQRLGVSEATVRRDLADLTAAGRVTRTYGGAVAGRHPVELDLAQKEVAHRVEKADIARHAAGLVDDGDVLILDAGTTTAALAGELSHHSGLTVVTNGVNTLQRLARVGAVDLIVLGGRLRHRSQAMVGPVAERDVRQVVAHKVFLGADGISGAHGLSCPTLEQASLKGVMAAQGTAVFVLADHSKLGAEPFPFFLPLQWPCTVITDAGTDAGAVAALEQNPQLRVVRAAAGTSADAGTGRPEGVPSHG